MRISLYLLLCTFVFVTSCDKETTEQFDSDIVGTWSVVSGTGDGTSVTTYGGDTYTANFTSRIVDPTAYETTTRSDGTVTSTGSVTMEITTDFNGQTNTSSMTISNVVADGTYEVIGNRLIVRDDQGEEHEVNIVSLTDTELSLQGEIVQTQENNGARTESRQEVTYLYERVN